VPKLTTLQLRLRNAYEAHDRDDFERALTQVGDAEARAAAAPCFRAGACVCVTPAQRSTCGYRSARPTGGSL
jgi:hypothetical protein